MAYNLLWAAAVNSNNNFQVSEGYKVMKDDDVS